MQLQENTLFYERYRLIKILGRGGFSEVWLVEDTRANNKQMALKIYAPGTGLDDDGVKLFSQEFSLVFDMNHSNLLKPAHFDIYEQMPYLIMPFCERGSAAKLVDNISEDQAWHFLHDVASGLAYLHGKEPPVIHQDIKPDNVLIDGSGAFLITDFGISTRARSTLRKSVIVSENTGGTLAYMGPERFSRNNQPIKASDIWALGASMYELMTGTPPFGEHGGILLQGGADIPHLSENWSKDLKHIVIQCLQKETWDRPTAEKIVAWTQQHMNGLPVKWNDTPLPSPPAKRNLTAIIASITVTVCLCAGVLFYIYSNNNNSALLKECISHIEKGEAFEANDSTCKQAITEYRTAIDIIRANNLKTDVDVNAKLDKLSSKINGKFNDYVNRANTFINMGDDGREDAVILLEKALQLKDDNDVKTILNKLKIK
ncbi:MAG: serine/threonine protein kinase [Prevotellaceae bacterium]|jgi:serine/threonine protein kinase|nr:serine/threonine protein kinase [Prevotellaceae bacterium]